MTELGTNKNASSLQWTWSDGWILMSLFLVSGENGAKLHEVISAADATNHAIPTRCELSQAFSKFAQCELVRVIEDRYVIASIYLAEIRKAYKGRGGLFESPKKGEKWLKRSGLAIKNNQKIEVTDGEIKSAYQTYIKKNI
jgi:hypothetical protein